MEQNKIESSEKPSEKLCHESLDILNTLGTGTFSRVRLVKSKGDSQAKPMALKSIKKYSAIKMKQTEQLRMEKALLERLEHPFVPTLFGTFQDDRYLYFLMEFICGGELFSRLKKLGTLPIDDAKFYVSSLVVILQHLHSLDVIYRDLKPENILIDKKGYIKVVDFGFAKQGQDRYFTVCGTPEYLAPEIILNKGYSKEVDWWALGVILYEMLVGYPPYYDPVPFNIYQKVLMGRLAIPPEIDPEAASFIMGLLEPDAGKRTGAESARDHAWLRSFQFGLLERGEIPAPWVPELMFEDDTCYFENYPDSIELAPVPNMSTRDPFEGF